MPDGELVTAVEVSDRTIERTGAAIEAYAKRCGEPAALLACVTAAIDAIGYAVVMDDHPHERAALYGAAGLAREIADGIKAGYGVRRFAQHAASLDLIVESARRLDACGVPGVSMLGYAIAHAAMGEWRCFSGCYVEACDALAIKPEPGAWEVSDGR